MADDPSRKEKVAAGLKKLKQFQQRSGKKPAKQPSLNDQVNENRHSSPDLSRKGQDPSVQQDHQLVNKSASIKEIPESFSENSSSTSKSPISSTTPKRSSKEGRHSPKQEVSSTESIYQLRQQLNGLMNQTHDLLNGAEPVDEENSEKDTLFSLERRNQELAAQLSHQTQANQQLQFQLQELKSRLGRQQKESEREKEELRERAHKEQVSVKDQLQVHIQTIGILVAEKTELQSSLAQSQQTAKQRAAEVEELQGRLRGSRQRLSDIEKELSSSNSSGQQLDRISKDLSKDVDRLKVENYKFSKENEELRQQASELTEKLKSKTSDVQHLDKQVTDLQNKLSHSELYVQQLTNNSSHTQNGSRTDLPAVSEQLEDLHQEKLDLERKLSKYKDTLDRMSTEKEQLSSQYQAYAKQLNAQLDSSRDELRIVTENMSRLSTEKAELEAKLTSLLQSQAGSKDAEESINSLKEQLENALKEKTEVTEQLSSQRFDNEQMSLLIEQRETKLSEVESELSRLRDQELDKESLLEAIQSDKVAASRAVMQNKQLKEQLQELQDGFIKMNEDRLQLTEKLQNEQHVSKELGERLCQQEEELVDLRDQLQSRTSQLQKLEEASTRSQLQQHQIVDRMRHYEAQGQLTEMLQAELAQAQERNNALASQNSQLRMALARQAETIAPSSEGNDQAKRNDLVASLSASVRQLELERDQLLHQLEDQKNLHHNLQSQMKQISSNHYGDADDGKDVDGVSPEEYKNLKDSMNLLEERFRKTMEQIAEMEEQKQQLEHVVMQLQGETDTIADYITLYQIQRGAMRQRAEEKDMYIAQLARDREDLKTKLSELQELVVKLLEEKKQLQAYNLANDALRAPGKAKSTSRDRSNPFDEPVKSPLEKKVEEPVVNGDAKQDKPKESTAKKIMELLADIGTSNLIENPLPDTFHPCPVCSGRLMTV